MKFAEILAVLIFTATSALSAQGSKSVSENKLLVISNDAWILNSDNTFSIRSRIPNIGSVLKEIEFSSNYLYEGKSYRKLSNTEVSQFDAMPRLSQKLSPNGGSWYLYYDGVAVETNRAIKKKLLCAYFWNGGVIIMFGDIGGDGWSRRVAFLDIESHTCIVRPSKWKGGYSLPEFLVPVAINESNADLVFDVSIPQKHLSTNSSNAWFP